jgi:hypothetical protein
MNNLKRVLLFALAIMMAIPASAETFEEIRKKASTKGTTLSSGEITGVIVGDYRSPNAAINHNTRYDFVDLRNNKLTNYIQSEDGKYGFRLIFDCIYDNRLKRADKVKINLAGCVITREDNPERYTISGLKLESAERLAEDVTLATKEKSISELTDTDLYTCITLKDVEFMNKQGDYTNVFEMMPQRTFMNQDRNPWSVADGWASLLKDSEGESIYMLVNSTCSWRRKGTGVPKGVGKISGVLVHEYIRRYGDNLGKYSIRPLNEQDVVKQMPKEESSSYEVIADWNYDRNYSNLIDIEGIGKVSAAKATRYSGRILPDEGQGFLSTTVGATVRLDTDYDTRYPNDNMGMRKYAGLRLEANVQNWLPKGNGVVVEVSTEGVTGKALTFDFSFGVGNHDAQNCWGFPAYWNVEYSIDGKSFKVAKHNIVLRALPYTFARLKGLDNVDRMPNCDMAMGFTDHSVKLPASLLGQKSVTIRLTPASRHMATIPTNEMEDSIQGEITSEINKPLVLRMGRITVKAVK